MVGRLVLGGGASHGIGHVEEQFRLHLSNDEKRRLSNRTTEDSEAYQLYLRGRYSWYKGTPESYETSRRYYVQAIEKDPAYALAYMGLGSYYLSLADDGLSPPREVFPKAKAAALKAIEIDPNLGQQDTPYSAPWQCPMNGICRRRNANSRGP